MKICLIGNSHIACVREAWSKDDHGLDITFFGSHGDTLLNIKNEANTLIPCGEKVRRNFRMTSGGREQIDLKEYDLFILHGLISRPMMFRDYDKNLRSSTFYSNGVLYASNPFYSSICYHVIKEIRKTCSRSILVSHVPYPAYPESKRRKIKEHYHDKLKMLIEEHLSDFGAKFLEQHPKTILDHRYTLEKFSKGSKRLDVEDVKGGKEHPKDDFNHMNKDFGKFYLKRVKSAIEKPFA